jgi:hypothetical protein
MSNTSLRRCVGFLASISFAIAGSPVESWVTDSEFMTEGKSHPRGANGSTFAARIKWSQPNRAQ